MKQSLFHTQLHTCFTPPFHTAACGMWSSYVKSTFVTTWLITFFLQVSSLVQQWGNSWNGVLTHIFPCAFILSGHHLLFFGAIWYELCQFDIIWMDLSRVGRICDSARWLRPGEVAAEELIYLSRKLTLVKRIVLGLRITWHDSTCVPGEVVHFPICFCTRPL